MIINSKQKEKYSKQPKNIKEMENNLLETIFFFYWYLKAIYKFLNSNNHDE